MFYVKFKTKLDVPSLSDIYGTSELSVLELETFNESEVVSVSMTA